MSYTITARIYQTSTTTFFRLVEKTVFRAGIWADSHGDQHVLRMNNSGTSGSLRFLADNGESFIVTLGVHNYVRWGDIVTGLDPQNQTGVVITPEYYEAQYGGSGNASRIAQRQRQLTRYEVTRNGRRFSFNYTVAEGNDLVVDVVVG